MGADDMLVKAGRRNRSVAGGLVEGDMGRRLPILASLGMALAGLAGCASLSQDQCMVGDWRLIGYQDGVGGQPASRVGEHGEACARYGVTPNLDIWQIGYQEGLVQYCTRSNGFRAGVNGNTYYGVCQGQAADEFMFAYRDGREVYDVRQALSQARSDGSSVTSRIQDLEGDRDWARQQAAAKETSDDDRRRYLDDVERYSEEIGDLRRQERDIEFAVQRIQSDVWNVESRMRSFYPEWNGY